MPAQGSCDGPSYAIKPNGERVPAKTIDFTITVNNVEVPIVRDGEYVKQEVVDEAIAEPHTEPRSVYPLVTGLIWQLRNFRMFG